MLNSFKSLKSILTQLKDLQNTAAAEGDTESSDLFSNAFSSIESSLSTSFSSMGGVISAGISAIFELNNQLLEASRQAAQLRIQEANIEINATLKVDELEKQWREFRSKVLDDTSDTDYLGKLKNNLRDIMELMGTIDTDYSTNGIDSWYDNLANVDFSSTIGTVQQLTDKV
jgi:hypothetical protein